MNKFNIVSFANSESTKLVVELLDETNINKVVLEANFGELCIIRSFVEYAAGGRVCIGSISLSSDITEQQYHFALIRLHAVAVGLAEEHPLLALSGKVNFSGNRAGTAKVMDVMDVMADYYKSTETIKQVLEYVATQYSGKAA